MKPYSIITELSPESFESEHYRKLRTNIDFISLDNEYKIINVTSSLPNEGKTYTILNLANVYAQNKKKTLLIDLDLRNPKIHHGFNLVNEKGIANCVNSEMDVNEAIYEVNDNLHVLLAGKKVPFPTEFILSKKLNSIIQKLRDSYDKILIDSPPVVLFSDAKIISSIADGTIFIVAAKKVKTEVIKRALRDLRDSNIDLLGSVFTQVPSKNIPYGKDYAYKKYYR